MRVKDRERFEELAVSFSSNDELYELVRFIKEIKGETKQDLDGLDLLTKTLSIAFNENLKGRK